MFPENYETDEKKKWKKTQINGNISRDHGLEDLIL